MEALGVCEGDLASIEEQLSKKFKAKASDQDSTHYVHTALRS